MNRLRIYDSLINTGIGFFISAGIMAPFLVFFEMFGVFPMSALEPYRRIEIALVVSMIVCGITAIIIEPEHKDDDHRPPWWKNPPDDDPPGPYPPADGPDEFDLMLLRTEVDPGRERDFIGSGHN